MTEKRTNIPSFLVIYILIWTGFNLTFLISFPFMHTDESWLSGLSRTMLAEKSPAATEYFFNLLPRAPHAIKLLFHGLQIIFIGIAGYSLFSIRLLSLLTGAAALAVMGELLKKLKLRPEAGVILLSVQIQFIYASHFGRQEIILLLLMLLSLSALMRSNTKTKGSSTGFGRGLITGIPVAVAVGFHPNAFITAWPAGLLLLTGIIRKKRRPAEGAGFLLLPAAAAAVFVLISFRFNSGFVSDYGGFGEEVGVFEAFDVKLLGFDDYFRKLFLRVSGTYYTPRIWPVFILAAAAAVALLLRRTSGKPVPAEAAAVSAAGLCGVSAGILIIGKYSAPSVVFMVPFLIILITAFINSLPVRIPGRIAAVAAAAILTTNSAFMVYEEISSGDSYREFAAGIEESVPPPADGKSASASRVLGPLTAEFALEYGRLLDWRNMTSLHNAEMSLEKYIRDNSIEYIIYTDELDIIYENRPVWNVLYGNPTIYHGQLQSFIEKHCEPVAEFTSPGYGTRIAMHRGKEGWRVRVYRLK